ncbi:MAG TPA: GNAT family N-acetyltransferase [Flavitalea sp.]|nr:GNAT family N-acetyltransferase [Flavitalea sp.]
MHITQKDNPKFGSFFIEEKGNRIAELAYTWRGNDVISIDHTEVDENAEGKGLGSSLVEHVVSFARKTGIKVILYCPFAKTVFERHKNFQDVLAEG